MNKPELLLPAGNIEAFYAALNAGADAIYVGLPKFNARNRAHNFTNEKIMALVKEAHKKGVKVLVTLNTVIKSKEIPELLDTLFFLTHLKPDAVIVQDVGVLYLIRKFFPSLVIHASTQMTFHNSLGPLLAQKIGLKRVVLARELTLSELEQVAKTSPVELEVFVHGALCYSISGLCLFSSYLGGRGANRGNCAQPCRRIYTAEEKKSFMFSLKDNSQLELVPQLAKMGVTTLKVEGRMKSASYVSKVGGAYRSALDQKNDIDPKDITYDYGREKTGFFLSGSGKDAFTQFAGTGIAIGKLLKVEPESITVETNEEILPGYRLRLVNSKADKQTMLKVKQVENLGDHKYRIASSKDIDESLNLVCLVATSEEKFPDKLNEFSHRIKAPTTFNAKGKVLAKLPLGAKQRKTTIYVRINSLQWLRKVRLEEFDYLIIKLSKSELAEFKTDVRFLQQNKSKLIFELPSFIFEKQIPFFQEQIDRLFKAGFTRFMTGHISQLEITHHDVQWYCNENTYVFNDAAAAFLMEKKVRNFVLPYENEYDNLNHQKNRQGIVPLYFYPTLFLGRMPVEAKSGEIIDDTGIAYQKEVRDGLTVVLPQQPVSLLQFKEKLEKEGFKNFLVDLSGEKESKHILAKLLTRLHRSQQIQPSTIFNFKRGMA